jgi:hypothetical protein
VTNARAAIRAFMMGLSMITDRRFLNSRTDGVRYSVYVIASRFRLGGIATKWSLLHRYNSRRQRNGSARLARDARVTRPENEGEKCTVRCT